MRMSTIVICCVALLALGCGDGSGGDSGNYEVTHDVSSNPDVPVAFEYDVDKSCLKFFPVEPKVWFGPPKNVMAAFRVENCEGRPVPLLSTGDFDFYDDGDFFSEDEAKRAVVNPKQAHRMYTLLLLDMSGSILNSGHLPTLLQSAGAFVGLVGKSDLLSQELAIYTFDGRMDIQQVQGFTNDTDLLAEGVAEMGQPQCETEKDCPVENPECVAQHCINPSTNLNGAILSSLKILDDKEATYDPSFLRQGYLIVFTDGTDQLDHPDFEHAPQEVVSTSHAVFTIGLGSEINPVELQAIGKDGTAFAENSGEVEAKFREIANEVIARSLSYYTLVYCSARGGAKEHSVSILVAGSVGSLGFQYDSGVFTDGLCDVELMKDPCKNIECGQSAWLNCGTCDACGTECLGGSCVFTACEGKPCGDDGCDGLCPNTCAGPQDGCVANECVCQPNCDGKECGSDGCDGSCGVCEELEDCIDGQCVCSWSDCGPTCCQEGQVCAGTSCCTPDCEGQTCGTDGCEGSCGECVGPQDACVLGLCECQPACGGKVCGSDGCGGSCGSCLSSQDACVEGYCVCQAECEGKDCGDDGCEGSCGSCQGPQDTCVEGDCICQPECEGKGCGDDGCGGVCGACNVLEVCLDDKCACAWLQCGANCCQEGQGCVDDVCCTSSCEEKTCGNDGCGGSCGVCNVHPNSYCSDTGVCECIKDCEGKDCGDDSCGGICGECSVFLPFCDDGTCSQDCQPDCVGKMCGGDGCGGSCGVCPVDMVCVGGLCYATSDP